MDDDEKTFCNPGDKPGGLDTVDAVARAAHLWIRSLYLSEHYHENERQSVAGGLLAGLCERLELDPRIRDLVAYVYVLLGDEDSQALSVSRMMLTHPISPELRRAYERGRAEAAAIVEMLSYHHPRL